MTEDNANKKLTLSGKTTLTLKLGGVKPQNSDGKKMVQVEVRKKRVMGQTSVSQEKKPKIDEETAAKLKLIAEAKEFDNKRRQEEEERNLQRQKQKEEEMLRQKEAEEEKKRLADEEARKKEEQEKHDKKIVEPAPQKEAENRVLSKFKERQKHDFDDDDDDDDENYGSRVNKKAISK